MQVQTLALQTASSLHLMLAKAPPSLRRSREHRELVDSVAWWVDEHSNALVQHIRRASPGYASGRSRAAAQSEVGHLLALCLSGPVHPSITDRLRRECAAA